MTVAKLMQNGELRVKGIDTRLPLVTDGLVAHYPMDGTTKGVANNNILDYSTWNIGTSGDQTGFSQNGDGNSIVEDVGPFGESQAIWQTLGNDTISDADGGWNGSSFVIDRTKKYRHSVWIRRKVTGNGTGYFGCLGYSVYNIAANTVNTNPYFWNGAFPNNDWLLFVSYVYPSDIGNIVPIDDAGIYNTTKTKLSSIGTFKFSPTATTNNHRTYLYYSTIATTNQQWVYPRVDLCDGTEPSIDDLLSGEGNVINPYSESSITKTNEYVAIEEATTNLVSPITTAFANWGGLTGSSVYYDTNSQRKGVKLITLNSGGVNWYNSGDQKVVSPSTVYTVSAKIKYIGGTPSPNLFYIRQYNSSGTQTSESGKYSASYQHYIGDGWYKAYGTFTTDSTATKALVQGYEYSANRTVWIEDVQLEQKAFATEYVNGSRSGDGTIVYNSISVGEDRGTIIFEAYIESYVYSTTSYIDMFDFISPSSNRFLILRKSANQSVPETMFIRNGASYNTAIISSKLIPNGWNSIAWTWDINSGYTMIVNNVVVSASTSYTKSNLPSIQFIFRKGWNVRNLSIYNRALSDSEVTKISKGTHSFTQDGLITKSINTTGEIRYIRDYLNGSTANTGNHWIEIKANTQDGTNVALGKIPTSNSTLTSGSVITDGNVNTTYSSSGAGLSYVQIDLGAMYLIDNIQVWHYYPDLRTYYSTRTQVSHDGVKWYDVFNSANDGTYQETINGKTHYVGGSGSSAMSAKVSGLTMNGINSTATL